METWIITGASRGLGRHLARQLALGGAQVIACARDTAALEALAATLPAGRLRPFPLDLSDAAQIAPRMRELLGELPRIDGLINNAGVGHYKPFIEHSEAELLQIVQVNLTAVIQLCHQVVPRMIAQGRGQIINIGSDLARRPLANMAAYVAAKHGLAGFSHSLLREVKDAGVKVSLINPGIIDTHFGGGTEGSRDEAWSLRPEALARLIVQIIQQPGNLTVDELTVHPLGQAEF